MNHSVCVAALCMIGAHADELSFTAVSMSAVSEDWDGFDDNPRGVRLDASVEIGAMYYFWGSASRSVLRLDVPDATSDIATHVRSVGVGIYRRLADEFWIHGEVGAMRHTVEYRLLPTGFHLDESRWVDEENAIRETEGTNG